LACPERLVNSAARLDLLKLTQLEFKPIDEERYPCLDLARQALRVGGTAPTILNAANEIAVQSFVEGNIKFTDIALLIDQVLQKIHSRPVRSIEVILEDDGLARAVALEIVEKGRTGMASLSDTAIMSSYAATS
jgi:1-deoxy-D-xylulose-5-phosphate reductoisomerase